MNERLGIVGGCGHVGLPLAIALADAYHVVVYDTDARAVEAATEALAHGTEAFAAARMNRGIREALAGRNVNEI